MRHYLIDETKRGEVYARRHLVHRRDHWWFGVPTRPSCWLLGHSPELASSTYGGVRAPCTDHWVRCSRCHCRPTLRLPEYRIKELVSGAWTPTREWLADLDTRAGWSAPHQAELSLTTIVPRRPAFDLAAHLHVGGAGSETPWDVHLGVGGLEVYLGVGFGGRLADRVSGKAHTRDLRIDIAPEETAKPGGLRVWWDLWTGEDMGGSHLPAARWRSGFKRVSPADWIFGKPELDRVVVGEHTAAIGLGDAMVHNVRFRLERWERGRPRQSRATWSREWFVDWDLERGPGSEPVGTRQDSDGTWTRGRVYGSGFALTEAQARSARWAEHAIQEFYGHVSEMRAREETNVGG